MVIGYILFFFLSPLLIYHGYKRARERGLRAPVATALGATCGMVAPGLVIAVVLSSNLPDPAQLLILILMPFYSFPMVTLLIRALPVRSGRVYGPRRARVPFTLLGTVVILITCVLYGTALYRGWIDSAFFEQSVTLAAVGVLAGLYMIRLAKRLKSRQVPTALVPRDNEPIGAIYLRSFRQESQYFVYGKSAKYDAYGTSFRARVIVKAFDIGVGRAYLDLNVGVRFDEYFREAVSSSAGPFVALGNPEDYIPSEGALRLYAKDSDWKERLDGLARRALWIMVEIGSSDH